MEYDEWREQLQTTTVPVDEHELDVAYYDEGEGDPVLFLHGIPTSSFLWRHAAPEIAADRRVIAPDMVGYGQSDMRDSFDRSIRAQEAMIDALLDDLGIDSITFVGHDLGGGVALRYAVHEPDRVDALVLSNAVAYDSWPIDTILDLGLPDTIEGMDVEDLQGMLDGMLQSTLAGEPDDAFVEGIEAPWRSETAKTSLSRNAIGTNTSHTTEVDPSEIAAPTLLLWGADDEFQPVENAERLESDIGDAEVVGLDDAYHWVPEDKPDEYTRELRSFLDGT